MNDSARRFRSLSKLTPKQSLRFLQKNLPAVDTPAVLRQQRNGNSSAGTSADKRKSAVGTSSITLRSKVLNETIQNNFPDISNLGSDYSVLLSDFEQDQSSTKGRQKRAVSLDANHTYGPIDRTINDSSDEETMEPPKLQKSRKRLHQKVSIPVSDNLGKVKKKQTNVLNSSDRYVEVWNGSSSHLSSDTSVDDVDMVRDRMRRQKTKDMKSRFGESASKQHKKVANKSVRNLLDLENVSDSDINNSNFFQKRQNRFQKRQNRVPDIKLNWNLLKMAKQPSPNLLKKKQDFLDNSKVLTPVNRNVDVTVPTTAAISSITPRNKSSLQSSLQSSGSERLISLHTDETILPPRGFLDSDTEESLDDVNILVSDSSKTQSSLRQTPTMHVDVSDVSPKESSGMKSVSVNQADSYTFDSLVFSDSQGTMRGKWKKPGQRTSWSADRQHEKLANKSARNLSDLESAIEASSFDHSNFFQKRQNRGRNIVSDIELNLNLLKVAKQISPNMHKKQDSQDISEILTPINRNVNDAAPTTTDILKITPRNKSSSLQSSLQSTSSERLISFHTDEPILPPSGFLDSDTGSDTEVYDESLDAVSLLVSDSFKIQSSLQQTPTIHVDVSGDSLKESSGMKSVSVSPADSFTFDGLVFSDSQRTMHRNMKTPGQGTRKSSLQRNSAIFHQSDVKLTPQSKKGLQPSVIDVQLEDFDSRTNELEKNKNVQKENGELETMDQSHDETKTLYSRSRFKNDSRSVSMAAAGNNEMHSISVLEENEYDSDEIFPSEESKARNSRNRSQNVSASKRCRSENIPQSTGTSSISNEKIRTSPSFTWDESVFDGDDITPDINQLSEMSHSINRSQNVARRGRLTPAASKTSHSSFMNDNNLDTDDMPSRTHKQTEKNHTPGRSSSRNSGHVNLVSSTRSSTRNISHGSAKLSTAQKRKINNESATDAAVLSYGLEVYSDSESVHHNPKEDIADASGIGGETSSSQNRENKTGSVHAANNSADGTISWKDKQLSLKDYLLNCIKNPTPREERPEYIEMMEETRKLLVPIPSTSQKVTVKRKAKPKAKSKPYQLKSYPIAVTKKLMTHYCHLKVRKDAIEAAHEASGLFFDRVREEIHGMMELKETNKIDGEMFKVLMKRAGLFKNDYEYHAMIHDYLPAECWDSMLPCNYPYLGVIPAKKKQKTKK